MGPLVVLKSNADLSQMAGALRATTRLANVLDRRQKQRGEHADHGNDNKQFDQRYPLLSDGSHRSHSHMNVLNGLA
jgi:hypothetical protein